MTSHTDTPPEGSPVAESAPPVAAAENSAPDKKSPARKTSSTRKAPTAAAAQAAENSGQEAQAEKKAPRRATAKARTAATPKPDESAAGTEASAPKPGRGRARKAQPAPQPETAPLAGEQNPPAEAPLDSSTQPESPRKAEARRPRARRNSKAAAQSPAQPTAQSLLPGIESPQEAPPPAAEAAPAMQSAPADMEQPAESPAAPLSEEDTDESPRRKSRRGRRGGRGRNRKNKQAAQDSHDVQAGIPQAGEADADAQESTATPEDADTQASTELKPAPDGTEPADTAATGQEDGGNAQGAPSADNQTAAKGKAGSKGKAGGKGKAAQGSKRMLISVLPGEQVEVALSDEGILLEYYLEMRHQRKIKGNIYKGVIHNIDTNLQAAFVSYGSGKNGFLQIDEVHPEYWQAHHEPAKGKKFPPIQKVLKTGQEVLVQVVKEPTGNKGAFLTTWVSLAGRFLVLTPGQEQIGVSRKVESEEERARLREMMNGIDPGQGLGVIVRTVSAGTTKTTLKTDLQYLKRLWRDIRKKTTESAAPALIYQEPGLSERAVRDYLTEDVAEIWVDNEDVAQTIRDTVSLLFPRKKDMVRLHTDARQGMWERFGLRRQLEQIYSREVTLPSGGRLVFDQTEALMAIDINSGKISGKGNFEAMAFKTNMEAAEAIARQLRLRDVGGQVVIDFIEMRERKHVAEVEKTLRQAMKNDRARHDVAHMSSFGLLELVRQRTGSSALAITMEPCPACAGTGQRRNLEWQALQSLRELRRLLRAHGGEKCVFETTPELGLYLLNHKRDTLREMEQEFGKCLEISIKP